MKSEPCLIYHTSKVYFQVDKCHKCGKKMLKHVHNCIEKYPHDFWIKLSLMRQNKQKKNPTTHNVWLHYIGAFMFTKRRDRVKTEVQMFTRFPVCVRLCHPMDCSPPAPLFRGFSRQEYWSGLPFPSPRDLPDPGIEPASLRSLALQVDSILLSHQGIPSWLLLASKPEIRTRGWWGKRGLHSAPESAYWTFSSWNTQ